MIQIQQQDQEDGVQYSQLTIYYKVQLRALSPYEVSDIHFITLQQNQKQYLFMKWWVGQINQKNSNCLCEFLYSHIFRLYQIQYYFGS
ncbi:unnamed protein product [Paramecium octaurelia]|uniref:Uncharacterized protein n=1 Tax=Paramecium octaurelia TaxID=43137 RepID=A0A8S1SAE9_PAROT|nr:unnamed protein product [Paramecium octaurelia]